MVVPKTFCNKVIRSRNYWIITESFVVKIYR